MSTPTPPSVLLELRGAVGVITLNRPARRNAMDQGARGELAEAFHACQNDPDVRVVVLTGAGAAFCAGVDLGDAGPATPRGPLDLGQPLAAPVESCPLPVLAAINGAAVGGGFELALAADLRVAAPDAFFALTELRIGSLPGSGGTQRLFASLPAAVAWHLLLTGERLTAERAEAYGLVSAVYPAESFHDDVMALAARIADAAPLSLRAAKLAARAAQPDTPIGHTLERVLWSLLAGTEDRAEGRAAFRDKRPPQFRGR